MTSGEAFNVISLFGVDIDQWSGFYEVEHLLQVLSREEIERADRLQVGQLKQRFLWGRFFLRQVLGSITDVGASKIQFKTGFNGKPGLLNSKGKEGNFSFSRSDRFAVCCFTTGPRLGIDVELLKHMDEMAFTARTIYCDDRHVEWDALPEQKKQMAFYQSWTRKEAVAKIDGRGITAGVKGIDVPLGSLAQSETACVQLSATVSGQVQMKPCSVVLSDWSPFDEVTACVAFEADLPDGCEVKFLDRVDFGERSPTHSLGSSLPIVFAERHFSLINTSSSV